MEIDMIIVLNHKNIENKLKIIYSNSLKSNHFLLIYNLKILRILINKSLANIYI